MRDSVVDISALRELRGIHREERIFRIGGLTTWTDVIRTPLPRSFDGLKAAAREVGSAQIQNRGTIAGNLCNASPAADGVPPLLTLDAIVELASATAVRRMAVADFILGNRKTARRHDELLTAVLVPTGVENAGSSFLKVGSRRYLVISIVMAAALVQTDATGQITDARIAVGSCSAVARRLPQLERSLIGRNIRDGFNGCVQTDHLASLSPINDVRATAAYRVDAAQTMIERALNACLGAA